MPRTTQIEGTVVIRDVDLGANVRHYGFINLYECSVGDNFANWRIRRDPEEGLYRQTLQDLLAHIHL